VQLVTEMPVRLLERLAIEAVRVKDGNPHERSSRAQPILAITFRPAIQAVFSDYEDPP
jgi:hypothetical protein